jgi:hypothetical protein
MAQTKPPRVAPGRDDHERRQHVRRTCDRWIGVVTVDPDGRKSPVVTVRAEDISAGGLGVYAWTTLQGRGAALIPRTGGEPAIVGTDVVYCRSRSRHDFDCGLRFTAPPSEISIDDFRDTDGALVDLGAAASTRSAP